MWLERMRCSRYAPAAAKPAVPTPRPSRAGSASQVTSVKVRSAAVGCSGFAGGALTSKRAKNKLVSLAPGAVEETLAVLKQHGRSAQVIGHAVADPEKKVRIPQRGLVGRHKKFRSER